MDRIKTSFIDNYTIIFGAHQGNRVLTHTQMSYTHYDFIPTKACNWFHLAAYSPILIADILIFLYIYIHITLTNVDQNYQLDLTFGFTTRFEPGAQFQHCLCL